MKRRLPSPFTVGIFVLLSLAAAGESNAQRRFTVTVGGESAICRNAVQVFENLYHDFGNDWTWREGTEAAKWTEQTFDVINAHTGERRPIPLRHAEFDIDNDGIPEAIVSIVGSLRSRDVERWVILSKAEFAQASSSGFDPNLAGVPVIMPGTGGAQKNFAVGAFPQGQIVAWRWENTNHVLFVGHHFGQQSGDQAVITVYPGRLSDGVEPPPFTPQLKVVCRIQG